MTQMWIIVYTSNEKIPLNFKLVHKSMSQTGTVKINLEQNKIHFGQMALLTHPLPSLTHPLPGKKVGFFLLMIVVSMFNLP